MPDGPGRLGVQGTLARSVADTAALLGVLAGVDDAYLRGLRMPERSLLIGRYCDPVIADTTAHHEAVAAFESASALLEDLGHRIVDIPKPLPLEAVPLVQKRAIELCRVAAKPVIVAINGPALGAGLAIAASADLIITSEKGSLALPEIDVGLLGGGSHAARLFPHTTLRKMMFTGYRVPADELYRLGVVNQVTTPEGLMPAAMELANTIASKSPLSIGLAKQTLNAIEDMSLRDGYRYEQDMTAAIAKTEDAKEAQRAFLEKRAPVFVGR